MSMLMSCSLAIVTMGDTDLRQNRTMLSSPAAAWPQWHGLWLVGRLTVWPLIGPQGQIRPSLSGRGHSYLTLSHYTQLHISCHTEGKGQKSIIMIMTRVWQFQWAVSMVRDTPSPGPRVGASPGTRRRTPRAKSLKRMLGSSLSPFQERLKETEFYTKPVIDKFDTIKSVKVGIF